MNSPFNLFPESMLLGAAWVVLVWIFTAIIHVGFAIAILSDAELQWKHLRRRTFFVGGGFWAFATLVGGIFVVALYWLIHHSTLRPQSAPRSDSEPADTKPTASGEPNS
jgi:uncharacterized membrane protein